MFWRTTLATFIWTVFSLFSGVAIAGQKVDLVIGANAPELDQLAARELAAQMERLFDAQVTLTETPPAVSKFLLLVGSPATNPAIKEIAERKWSQLSDQGVVLHSFETDTQRGLVVGGGSPAATLWAVYELGYRWGIRYTLRDDIYPASGASLNLQNFDVVMEPQLRSRAWRTVNDFAIGPESWGLADHRRLLRQLAKMKFNRVMISVYPWQPFVHYEFHGVKKQSALLWYGEEYAIPRDAPGRTGLGGMKVFDNADFIGKKTYRQRIAAGTNLISGIIDEAHRLGMSVGISISPLEFPKEFAAALPGSEPARGLNRLTIRPGAKQRPDDALLLELVRTKITAYLETYPKIDALYLTLPEFPDWNSHAKIAWKHLADRRQLGDMTLEPLIQTASKRNLVASGDRGARAIEGNVVGLSFLSEALADLPRSATERPLELVIAGVDPALFPVLDRVVPPGAATLNFIDYTARRVVENRQLLSLPPANKVRCSLILTLADDNVGVLSQSATRSIEPLIADLVKHGWEGFSTRYWTLAELDPTVHYLSRVSWDQRVTAHSAHDDFFTAITGKQTVADRLWLGFGHMESATNLIDKNELGFAFPVRGMLMKHYKADPAPKWWDELTESYTQALVEMYRSHGGADPRSRKLLFYYAKRSEYNLEYLGCVKSLREAGIAHAKGDDEQALEHFETAIESLYNAIDTLGDVARDPSDRGLIAVLINHAYLPLLAEYEKLSGGE